MNDLPKKLINQNKEIYNKIAPLFAQTRKYLWDDLLPLKDYMRDNYRILDIGCGTGRLYHLFKDFQGIEYTGLDQSEKQIAEAKKEFPLNTYVISEMTSLPFADKSFDIIYCIATFHHLPTEECRVKALLEMKRVLVAGGHVLMTNWNLHSKSAQKNVKKGKWSLDNFNSDFAVPWMSPKGDIIGERYYHGFTLRELEEIFKKCGFEIEDQYYSKNGSRSNSSDGHNIISIITSK